MKKKRKPVKPISIKFDAPERAWILLMAKAQGHGKISKVVRRMVRRDMQGN